MRSSSCGRPRVRVWGFREIANSDRDRPASPWTSAGVRRPAASVCAQMCPPRSAWEARGCFNRTGRPDLYSPDLVGGWVILRATKQVDPILANMDALNN